MTYILDLNNGSSTTATSFTFFEQGGNTVVLHGTGFTYDEDGYLDGGTITSMTSTGFFGLEQTITLNVHAADLYTDLLAPVSLLEDQVSGWSNTDSVISSKPTKIVLEMFNSTRVVIEGTNLGQDPTKGKVTSLEHLGTDGTSLGKIDGLDVSLAVALGALGPSDSLFNYLTRGANTVTQEYAFGPDIEGGLGNDRLVGTKAAFPVAEYVHTAIAGIVGNLGTGKVTGGAGNDTLIGIGGISGSNFDDQLTGRNNSERTDFLTGNGGKDVIKGLAGTDYITGDDGNDKLYGGDGDDRLNGGAGDDLVDGGKGVDAVDFSGEALNAKGITLNLGKSGKQDFGAWGKDTLKSIENATGSAVGDHITGSNKANVISGNGGADVIKGMGGDDDLYGDTGPGGSSSGNSGADTMDGGKGNDSLHAGLGADLLIGGAGRDNFIFSALPNPFLGMDDVDRIKDFNVKDDTILLSSLYMEIDDGPLDKDVFVLGSTAKDAEDRILYDKASGKLYYDEDGKGGDDAVHFATLQNKAALTYHDFLV
jgi:Ca2+-binding RTX toxin-like protein